jgi:hypothetical protein
MSNAATELFEVWLKNQIELARRKLRDEWLSIDQRAAAEGWYGSGRRIKLSVGVIGNILRDLVEEAYPKAADASVSGEFHTSTTEQLFKLFDELIAEVSALLESTGYVSPRLEKTVVELMAPIRADLETSAKLAQLSTRSKLSQWLSSESSVIAMLPHTDPIPKNHISLNEALDLFRRAKRGRDSDVHPPHGTPEWDKWHGTYSEALEVDQTELAQPFLSGELEALVLGRSGKEYRITPSEWNSSAWPTRMFLSEEIHDLPGRPLAKHTGRTPYTYRPKFEAWLRFWVRDWLITELRYGRLAPSDAEGRAKEVGCEPLASDPDPALFKPMAEAYWTLTMALAWIVWRTEEAVRGFWRKYCEARWFFVFKRWRVGLDGEINEGWFLEQLMPSVIGLRLAEAYPTGPGAAAMLVDEAISSLWQDLGSAHLQATGIAEGTGHRKTIEAHEWQDLKLVEERDQDALIYLQGSHMGLVAYRHMSLPRDVILRVWPALAIKQSAPKPARKIQTKLTDDRKIITGVLEALSYGDEQRITELIRETARNLDLFPQDVDEQIKLTDRIRRQVRKQQQVS